MKGNRMLDNNPIAECTVGQRYEVEVPDTLDLALRMALAVNALTNVWYPEEKWALGFVVDFSRRPTELFPSHITDAYLNIPPKFLEALTVCRLASGNTDYLDVDLEVLRVQLDLLGDDGLTYCPTDTLEQFTEARPFAEVWAEGRLLLALSMLAQVDDNSQWADIGKKKVDRLLALTREKEGFRFLWRGRFRPGETVPSDADEPKGGEGGSLADKDPVFSMIYSVGALGHGSGLFYRATGYKPALELSGGLARWALARMFKNEDGRYTFRHFHHGLYALMAVCEYAVATNDREMLERVDACYRWAREMGDPLIGYYPEAMPGSDSYLGRAGNTVEICEVADMVFLALYLTRAGLDDYWDDVDRWVRNVYAEGQMCDTRFMDGIPDSYFATEPSQHPHPEEFFTLSGEGFATGSNVVIQGVGPMGICHVIKARMMGAGHIIATDRSDYRLALAKEFGVDHAINVTQTTQDERIEFVRSLTHGRGADIAVECAGIAEVVPEGLDMLCKGGIYIEVGNFVETGEVSLSPHRHFCSKNIRLIGMTNHPFTGYTPSMELMQRYADRVPFEKFVTHEYPLAQTEEAMLKSMEPEGCMKVVIVP